MKHFLLKTWLMLVCLLVGVGTTWAESFSTTYSYGLSDWSLTNYTDQSTYYQVPTGTGVTTSVATISGIFSGKTITSDVVVTINCATYGSGTDPDSNTFSLYKETACTNAITATNGGTLPTSSTYTNVTYTVTQANAASLGNDLAIKITKPGKTIRLKSIKVAFTYTSGGGSTNYTVTVANNITGGTVTASPTSAAAGATVTLTATPNTGYEFGTWNVTDASSNAITVTNNQFTMPAANVNVSATFNSTQGGGEPSGDGTTVTMSSFSAISGKVGGDANVSYEAAKGSASTAPAVNNNEIRVYQNGGLFTVTAATGYKLKSVIIGSSMATSINYKLDGGSEALQSSASISANGKYTASNLNNTSIQFICKGTTSSSRLYVNYLSVTYEAEESGDPEKTTPTLSFANATYNATMGEDFTAPALTNEQNVTVSYSSSEIGVATVNATTGAISLVAPGTTKITASFAGNETYNATSANYNLVVSPAPFACLEDLVAADLTTGTEVTVSFENVPIKQFQTVSSARKGVYFDIQKDGNDIEIYFTSEVPAGWAVGGTLSGTLTNCPWKLYSGTWELAPASGWSWSNLTYNAPANYAPTITTQPVSATYEFNASATNLTVAANGNPAPTYQWYSNTTNSNENGTILTGETNVSYKPSTATAGTFYYYCVATNSEGSAASSVATITVKEPVVASLPFEFDGGRDNIASKDGMSQTGLGSDYSSSPKLKFDSQGDNVIINFNEAAKKVTYTIKGNSTSGTYAFDVMESADGVEYTTVHRHTSITDEASYTDNLASTSRFVKFIYTTKANGNVALGKISIIAASYREEPNLAFDKATYKFIAGKDMQVAATSKAGSTGAITYALTEGDEDAFLIDENTGEIACYTAGTYTVTATIAETADYYSRSTTCTVVVADPVVGNSIIVAQSGENYYAMTTTCAGEYFTHTQIKKVGDKYVVSSLDDILFYTSTADGKTTIQSTSNNEYVQATAAKKVSYTEDEYKWANDGEKLTAATASHGTLQYNTSSPRFTTYATKVGQYATIVDHANVIVGDVVTLNAACNDGEYVYGTYSNASAWVVPEDLEVSEISIVDGELYVESYSTGAVVPANTGVMVSAEKWNEGTKDFAVALSNEAGTSVLGNDNALHPSSEEMSGDNFFYRLTMHNTTQIGFWWGAEDGAAFSLAANKAYLAVPKSAGSNLRLWFGDDTLTGINAVETSSNDAIFNLQGQRMNRVQKGVNIVNGRKVIR